MMGTVRPNICTLLTPKPINPRPYRQGQIPLIGNPFLSSMNPPLLGIPPASIRGVRPFSSKNPPGRDR